MWHLRHGVVLAHGADSPFPQPRVDAILVKLVQTRQGAYVFAYFVRAEADVAAVRGFTFGCFDRRHRVQRQGVDFQLARTTPGVRGKILVESLEHFVVVAVEVSLKQRHAQAVRHGRVASSEVTRSEQLH